MASEAPISHPAEWPLMNLRDITVKIGSGATPRGGSETYLAYRANYALVRSQNVLDRRFDSTGLAYISDEQARFLQQAQVCTGDLLLNITGDGMTFSRCCMIPDEVLPACVNQHVSIVRVNKNIAEPGYVLSFLTHPTVKTYIESFNAGGSRRAITKGHIESFLVPLPPLGEQQRISRVLGALDEKIALNRKMSGTLESMARALFKSWLVDFDPVRAKAEGRDPSLPAPIAALFPDSFDEAADHEMPSGWITCGLDQIACFLNGLALQKYPPKDGQALPVIKIAQLRTEETSGADQASADLADAYIVNDGDVLFSWSGSLACVLWAGGRGALNQHLFKVTSTKYPKWFYWLWILHYLEEFQAIAADKATTMGHIQRRHLSEARVLLPPEPLLLEMDKHFRPLVDQIVLLKIESKMLATYRDSLLPKLISGEIRLLGENED